MSDTTYDIQITEHNGDDDTPRRQSTTAAAKPAAAFLRAIADEIDPPRKATRGDSY